MKKVSINKINNLDCFRDAIREGENMVTIYPQLKWDNPNSRKIIINNNKEK